MRLASAVAAGVLAAVGGCSSQPSRPAAPAPPSPAPLAASLATGRASWVVVAMGTLNQASNRFWQLFVLPRGARDWSLATPPGVADNGGLVLASAGGGTLVVGFRPSQELTFSPLATTTDNGRSYAPGLVPAGLAAVPDALAVAPGGGAVALAGSGAFQVLAGNVAAASGWKQVTTGATVAASPAGRACGLLGLTAVAPTSTFVDLGASCGHPGVAGVLEPAGRGWRLAGPSLPASLAGRTVDVLRLTTSGGRMAALLQSAGAGQTAYLVARAGPATGTWSVSAALPRSGPVVATGTTPGGGFVLLTRGSAGLQLAVAEPAAPHWLTLPDPPAGTAAVALSTGRADAIVVSSTKFADYRLAGGRWVLVQRLTVPIEFGSSS